jgi:hypothetical protein
MLRVELKFASHGPEHSGCPLGTPRCLGPRGWGVGGVRRPACFPSLHCFGLFFMGAAGQGLFCFPRLVPDMSWPKPCPSAAAMSANLQHCHAAAIGKEPAS